MGGGQPFMYDSIPKGASTHPYNNFDPKAVSRASLTSKAPRPKQNGPLVSFNQHPDSYLVLPSGNRDVKQMNPSVKKRVTQTRIVQLVFRCVELLGGLGLLTTMILINGIDPLSGWLMRIPPGFAILHTLYAVYHLGRRPSGRTPASSASYMLFAAALDASLIPFYVFGSLTTSFPYFLSKNSVSWPDEWGTLLPAGQKAMPYLFTISFFGFVICGGLHLVSLALSLYLAVTFRKITKLPPDMNPLEDNLTSRHKRNKSSLSTSTISEKRASTVLESKRSSGAPYEDLSRPPSIPFLHTRQGSVESFSTYHSTPPPSRDSRLDLPSRQYQIQSNPDSPRSSVVELKRSSIGYNTTSTPPKRGSYSEIPLSDPSEVSSKRSSRQMGNLPEAWHTAESFASSQRSGRSSPRKDQSNARYHPLHQRHDSEENVSFRSTHPNPLEVNPPTPRIRNGPQRTSALTEIRLNSSAVESAAASGDVADMSQDRNAKYHQQENFKAKYYGDLKPATPPILVGGRGSERQVSSGNDYSNKAGRGFAKREVSGKIAEEGRGGGNHSTWGTRFRKVSGL